MQPALGEELVGGRGVGEGVGRVVGREQVLDDGAGFPEGDVGVVGVGDGGDAAVGVDGLEGFCCCCCCCVRSGSGSFPVCSGEEDGWQHIPWCRTLKSMSSVS